MKGKHWTWILAVTLLVSVGCSQDSAEISDSADGAEESKSEVEVAIDTLDDAWDEIEDNEEKVALARDFLEKYPGSEYTGEVLSAVLEPLVDELGHLEDAYTLFEESMASISDDEVKLEAQQQLAVLHSKAGRLDDLATLAVAMADEHEFKYTDYLDLMDTAAEAEAWELVIQQADASLALATPEAFQVQYDDISDEDAQKWGRRREAYSAAHKGWAQENLGQHEAALATFADNADKTTFSFLGVDDTPLHINWGKSLLLQGRAEEALKVLEREALYGPDEAFQAYSRAWATIRGSNDGLEEELWTLRQKNAVSLPQFALANYEGETVDTDDFKGDVMLVAAWFPT